MAESARAGRLRWRSRRGMKELDILLDGFITQKADALNRGEWPEFESLLSTEDDVLWDWMQNPEGAQPESLRPIIHEIRKCRATS